MTEDKKKRGPRKTLEQRMRDDLEVQRRLVDRLRKKFSAHCIENRELSAEHNREMDRLNKLQEAISLMETVDGRDSPKSGEDH